MGKILKRHGVGVILLLLSLSTLSGCYFNTKDVNTKNANTEEEQEETSDMENVSGINEGEEIEKEQGSEENMVDVALTNIENIRQFRDQVWKEYLQEISEDEVRKSEVENRVMKYQDVQMKYGLQIIGEPDENGYPLFIALHGGGQGDTPDVNDQQWAHMAVYYKMGITNGVYVNPRGVRDTWDTHGNPESFPLYDRLIENMIIHCNVDPNRVYIMGFSAGGDGVYIVAPRMADRFAAAHMSAGHHNGTSVTNLYNTPIQLQVGELDIAYDRHRVTVEYDFKLDELSKTYGGGYIHNVFVHHQKPHNFDDNKLSPQKVFADNLAWYQGEEVETITADTNAVHFLEGYTRNPLPSRVVWDLGNRADLRNVTSFYWLKAASSVKEGEIVVNYDKRNNTIHVEKETVDGKFSILVNEEMLDVFSPISVVTPKGTYEVMPTLSKELIYDTTKERGDYNYQFVTEIDYANLK